MPKRNHIKPPSDYRQRGFTSLHIKIGTKNRMNLAKALFAADAGRAVTHDDLINQLLDSHPDTKSIELVRELA